MQRGTIAGDTLPGEERASGKIGCRSLVNLGGETPPAIEGLLLEE
jgi:hypothetical protein